AGGPEQKIVGRESARCESEDARLVQVPIKGLVVARGGYAVHVACGSGRAAGQAVATCDAVRIESKCTPVIDNRQVHPVVGIYYNLVANGGTRSENNGINVGGVGAAR